MTVSEKSPLWILITGATSGIGYQTTLQLAKKGENVIAVGRNEKKLVELENISKESKWKIHNGYDELRIKTRWRNENNN